MASDSPQMATLQEETDNTLSISNGTNVNGAGAGAVSASASAAALAAAANLAGLSPLSPQQYQQQATPRCFYPTTGVPLAPTAGSSNPLDFVVPSDYFNLYSFMSAETPGALSDALNAQQQLQLAGDLSVSPRALSPVATFKGKASEDFADIALDEVFLTQQSFVSPSLPLEPMMQVPTLSSNANPAMLDFSQGQPLEDAHMDFKIPNLFPSATQHVALRHQSQPEHVLLESLQTMDPAASQLKTHRHTRSDPFAVPDSRSIFDNSVGPNGSNVIHGKIIGLKQSQQVPQQYRSRRSEQLEQRQHPLHMEQDDDDDDEDEDEDEDEDDEDSNDLGLDDEDDSYGDADYADRSSVSGPSFAMNSTIAMDSFVPPAAVNGKRNSVQGHPHRRMSKNAKMFKCDTCSSSFTRKTRLTEHKNRVHLGKVYHFECKTCGVRLSSKENLTRHKIVHTDKFKCNKCERRFDRSYRFQRHIEKCDGSS